MIYIPNDQVLSKTILIISTEEYRFYLMAYRKIPHNIATDHCKESIKKCCYELTINLNCRHNYNYTGVIRLVVASA